MTMITRRFVLALGLASIALAGCGGGADDTASSGDAKYTIAVLPKGVGHQFWLTVRSGADGYVLKDVAPADLRDAVVAVHEGREYFTARVTQQLSVGLRHEIEEEQVRTRVEALTPREREVLLHVAEGLTNREIGDRLEISPRTVETHRERVMGKTGSRTVAGLTRLVVQPGLATEPAEGGEAGATSP